MTTNVTCTSCLRALRQGARNEVRRQVAPSRLSPRAQCVGRAFSTTSTRRLAEDPKDGTDASAMQKFAQRMRAQKQMRAATEPYVAYGATEDLFRQCARAGEYTMPTVAEGLEPPRSAKGEDLGVGQGWWYEELGLTPTFNTWAQITYVHMYLVTVRLRMFPQQHAHVWHQNLLDHFSYAAEDRMVTLHNLAARSVRNKYLKDLFVQWRGVLAAYDEGLIKGDAVLASAVWRNVFGGDENVDVAAVANVVSYMKKSLKELDRMQDSGIASGDIKFADPTRESAVVARESKSLTTPLPETEPAVTQTGSATA